MYERRDVPAERLCARERARAGSRVFGAQRGADDEAGDSMVLRRAKKTLKCLESGAPPHNAIAFSM